MSGWDQWLADSEHAMLSMRYKIGRNHCNWVNQEIEKINHPGGGLFLSKKDRATLEVLEDDKNHQQIFVIKSCGEIKIRRTVGWFELIPLEGTLL